MKLIKVKLILNSFWVYRLKVFAQVIWIRLIRFNHFGNSACLIRLMYSLHDLSGQKKPHSFLSFLLNFPV